MSNYHQAPTTALQNNTNKCWSLCKQSDLGSTMFLNWSIIFFSLLRKKYFPLLDIGENLLLLSLFFPPFSQSYFPSLAPYNRTLTHQDTFLSLLDTRENLQPPFPLPPLLLFLTVLFTYSSTAYYFFILSTHLISSSRLFSSLLYSSFISITLIHPLNFTPHMIYFAPLISLVLLLFFSSLLSPLLLFPSFYPLPSVHLGTQTTLRQYLYSSSFSLPPPPRQIHFTLPNSLVFLIFYSLQSPLLSSFPFSPLLSTPQLKHLSDTNFSHPASSCLHNPQRHPPTPQFREFKPLMGYKTLPPRHPH